MSKGRLAALDRVDHMLIAADAIAEYVARGRTAFDTDPAIRDAILYQILVIGEAAKGALDADASLATELPEVEWSLMARMRDRIVHHYWTTDSEIVWSTATLAIPELSNLLRDARERLRP